MGTPAINYTARDFAAIKAAFEAHLKAKFPNDWKDFYASNIGNALSDLIAYAFDILSFQLDYTANELYLDTARDRRSILLLGRLVGYQMRTATSASVLCSGTIGAVYAERIIIPAGTVITSKGGVQFYVAEDQSIPAGSLTGDITIVQGRIETDNFTADGSAFQKYELTKSPVVQSTLEVTVNGETWTEYESLAYCESDTKGFVVEYDEDCVAYLMFGDDISGARPPAAATVAVTYRVGGGIVGNVALNEIQATVQGYREFVVPTVWVQVRLVNGEETGSGGEDQESLTHAKLWIPHWVRSNNRAVTEYDYDVLANTFNDPIYGSPSYAKAKLKQEIPELNTVELAVFGRDYDGNPAQASTGLKQAIEDYFNNDGIGSVRMLCQHCEVIDGEILYVDIESDVKLSSNLTPTQMVANITNAIEELFSSSELQPGDDFRISLLYNAIQDVSGVAYAVVKEIALSKKVTEIIAFGDGTTSHFTFQFELEPGLSIRKNTVRIYYGSATSDVLTDDGSGGIVNGSDVEVGAIDYDTGICSFTFASAPASFVTVYGENRQVLDYQRGEQESIGDGYTTRYRGKISYPPINPYDSDTHQKGIVFTDGIQQVSDDGNGNLVGDVDSSADNENKIDYTSGAYDFTFRTPPPNGTGIYSTYRQILQTASQDLPVDKEQLSTKGNITINVV